jgi:hypothetical protein
VPKKNVVPSTTNAPAGHPATQAGLGLTPSPSLAVRFLRALAQAERTLRLGVTLPSYALTLAAREHAVPVDMLALLLMDKQAACRRACEEFARLARADREVR